MTSTDTANYAATLKEVRSLIEAGCEIVRLAIPDEAAVETLARLKKEVEVPLVADIHFNYRMALASLEAGADKIRINPGTLGNTSQIKEVVMGAKRRKIPIRIGVNAGSLPKAYRNSKDQAEAMVKAVLEHINLLEDWGFKDIVLSVKSSSVLETVEAYKLLARQTDYPLHLGITEAGPIIIGTVKSSLGLGLLLSQGIGDTIRVSLTEDPVLEVRVGWEVLKALGLREGFDLIACPTCGRCEIDVIKLASEVEKALIKVGKPIKVAVMGCVVNGPGEAREADLGIAGGKTGGILFKHGQVVRKVPVDELVDVLISEVEKMVEEST
jgi:(E)-4-hydroxy-3-methylbut-2-enyl-diphosphate synthase